MRGPFYNVKEVYTLTGSGFSVGAHLKLLSEEQSRVAGLDIEAQNLDVLCCDPKEGHPALLHDVVASISPSFRGLDGSVRVQGRPEERLKPVVKAIGLKLYGTFEQSAGSADNSSGWEDWTRLRKVRTGTREDTKAPIYETQTATVRLKLTKATGDETTDYEPLTAQVLARAGTLQQGDLVTRDESYVVTATPMQEGEFERAELRMREY